MICVKDHEGRLFSASIFNQQDIGCGPRGHLWTGSADKLPELGMVCLCGWWTWAEVQPVRIVPREKSQRGAMVMKVGMRTREDVQTQIDYLQRQRQAGLVEALRHETAIAEDALRWVLGEMAILSPSELVDIGRRRGGQPKFSDRFCSCRCHDSADGDLCEQCCDGPPRARWFHEKRESPE